MKEAERKELEKFYNTIIPVVVTDAVADIYDDKIQVLWDKVENAERYDYSLSFKPINQTVLLPNDASFLKQTPENVGDMVFAAVKYSGMLSGTISFMYWGFTVSEVNKDLVKVQFVALMWGEFA